MEIAAEKTDLAVSVLRLFAPAHLVTSHVSRVAPWNQAPQRSQAVFIGDGDRRCVSFREGLSDLDARMQIDDNVRPLLEQAGLSEMRQLVAKDAKNEFEDVLLSAIAMFGRAALTSDHRERLVWYCAGLESILLRSDSEPIVQNLSERLALFTYDSLSERKEAVAQIRSTYALRSKFVHHGEAVGDASAVRGLAAHGIRFFVKTAKRVSLFPTKLAFLESIEGIKLSGPAAAQS